MQLYYLPTACTMAVRIVVHELALPCEFVEATPEVRSSSAFLRQNPLNKVPVLVTDSGEVITELTAVLSYLSAREGGALVPRNPLAVARVYEFISLFASEMHSLFIQSHQPHRIIPETELHPRLMSEGRSQLLKLLAVCDSWIGKGPYVAGAEFTIADAVFVVVYAWSVGLKLPIADFRNIVAWVKRVAVRPSVVKALTEEKIPIQV